MTLWIKLLSGDLFSIPFSPPIISSQKLYQYLHSHYYPNITLYQIHLFHNGNTDLSKVKEEDILDLFISEPYAEKWVTDFSKNQENYRFHQSGITWYDGRWGDPYEDPSVLKRTSLTTYIHVRENTLEEDETKRRHYTINHNFFKELYPPSQEEAIWHSTLEEAFEHYREHWNKKQNGDSFTELTMKHMIHLWNLYHGTNYHLIEKGRYYDY